MKKLFFSLVVAVVPLGLFAQEQIPTIDINIINSGIKEHFQQKTKTHQDSLEALNQQLAELKKQKQEADFHQQIDSIYLLDKNTTIIAMNARENDLKISHETLQNIIGKIINKQVEFQSLFSGNDSIPSDKLQEINSTVALLGKELTIGDNQVSKIFALNANYSPAQKEELTKLLVEYRRLDLLSKAATQRILFGKEFLSKMDNDIANRKAFIAEAKQIQEIFEKEVAEKTRIVNSLDSIITNQERTISSQTLTYSDNKKQLIVVKDGSLSPQENEVFTNIENYLNKEVIVDTEHLVLDSINSNYFKDQHKRLLQLNIELAKKRKINEILTQRLDFISSINVNLKNSLESVYKQEKKSYEAVISEENTLKTRVNNAKNGIFEENRSSAKIVAKPTTASDSIQTSEKPVTKTKKRKRS